LRNAESAFRSHHYEDALDWAKRAAKEMPRNGRVFLLLSQTHLAVGEYRDAAGAARLGMSLLPPEDWGYVVKNFRSYYHDADYVAQVRRLERFIAENPNHDAARLLLGYHWLFLSHPNAANRELTKAAELNPRDEWAGRLLELAGGAVPRPLP
jgi:tetratricopeptide (TPR) repeat protein